MIITAFAFAHVIGKSHDVAAIGVPSITIYNTPIINVGSLLAVSSRLALANFFASVPLEICLLVAVNSNHTSLINANLVVVKVIK